MLDNILDAVGRTPLVRLGRIARGIRTPVYGKLENLNPGGSVKDRIGLSIIEAAERSGALKAGRSDRRGHEREHRAWAWPSPPRSRATAASSPSPTRCPWRRCACSAPTAPRSSWCPPPCPPSIPSTTSPRRAPSWPPRRARSWPTSTTTPRIPRPTTATTGPGALGADRREDHALRVLAGHGGHDHGHRRATSRRRTPRSASSGGDPVGSIYKDYARTHVKGPGPALQGGRHRGRQDPDLAGLRRGRRVDHGERRRRLPHRASSHPRGGHLPRRLGRASTCSPPSTWHGVSTIRTAYVVTILCDTGERYLSKLYDDNWMRENQMLDAERVTAGQLLEQHARTFPPSSPWPRWPTCARP